MLHSTLRARARAALAVIYWWIAVQGFNRLPASEPVAMVVRL